MKLAVLRSASAYTCPSFASYKIFRNFRRDPLTLSAPRLYASAASAVDAAPPLLLPSLLPSEPSIFPELLEAGKSSALVGIDPDMNGAMATLRWRNPAALAGVACAADLAAAAEIEIFDMPTEIIEMRTRTKKQPSAEGVLGVARAILDKEEADGSAVRVALEFTNPTHLSGKYAWYCSGFATGLLTGVFMSKEVPFQRVPAVLWKRQMGLNKLGKEGSLALARQLFPQAADLHLK